MFSGTNFEGANLSHTNFRGAYLGNANMVNSNVCNTNFGQYAAFNGHKGKVYCVSFSQDGKLLLSSGEDCKIIIWDRATSKLLNVLEGHMASVRNVCFSKNGNI